MKNEFAIPELKYRLGKYLFQQLLREGVLDQAQYDALRDSLLDVYNPVIGALERGASGDY